MKSANTLSILVARFAELPSQRGESLKRHSRHWTTKMTLLEHLSLSFLHRYQRKGGIRNQTVSLTYKFCSGKEFKEALNHRNIRPKRQKDATFVGVQPTQQAHRARDAHTSFVRGNSECKQCGHRQQNRIALSCKKATRHHRAELARTGWLLERR